METPDVIYINSDGMIITKGDGDARYHHSRIVEALRRENEELKAKLDKAKDALRFYGDKHEYPNDGPFGTCSTDFGQRARTTLEEVTK